MAVCWWKVDGTAALLYSDWAEDNTGGGGGGFLIQWRGLSGLCMQGCIPHGKRTSATVDIHMYKRVIMTSVHAYTFTCTCVLFGCLHVHVLRTTHMLCFHGCLNFGNLHHGIHCQTGLPISEICGDK